MTNPRLAGLVLTAAILGAQSASAQSADPADVGTLDDIIRAYYEVVSGPAGEAADRDRDFSLHVDGALVGLPGRDAEGNPRLNVMSLGDYHDRAGGPRSQPFYEREVHREVHRFGNVAQVFSTYESSREPEGAAFTRGINSIQLTWDGTRWWIVSWIFDQEREGLDVPARYLPGN